MYINESPESKLHKMTLEARKKSERKNLVLIFLTLSASIYASGIALASFI
jgi:hypothetical protein